MEKSEIGKSENMYRKLLTILVSMLFVSIIPSVVGGNTELEKEPCLDVGRTFWFGVVLFANYTGTHLTCYAIYLRYDRFSPTEKDSGVYIMKWISIPFRDSAYMGRMYEIRACTFGVITIIFGLFPGGLDID